VVLALGAAACSGDRFSTNDGGAGTGGTATASPDAGGGGRGTIGAGGGAGNRITGSSGGAGTTAGGAGGTLSTAGAGGVPLGAGGDTIGAGGGGTAGAGGSIVSADAGPRWCAGQNVGFCEDFDGFDTVDAFLESWTSSSTTGGTFSFDTSANVPSAPNALRVRTSDAYGVTTLVMHTVPNFAARPKRVRLEFDFRLDAGFSVDPYTTAGLAGLAAGTRSSNSAVAMEIGYGPVLGVGYYDATDGSTGDDVFTSAFPPENQWLGRYALEITYTATAAGTKKACAQAYVHGQPQLKTCLPLPPSLVDPALLSIVLGVGSGGLGNTNDVQLRFDNVTLVVE
jgi:hypothetical protein